MTRRNRWTARGAGVFFVEPSPTGRWAVCFDHGWAFDVVSYTDTRAEAEARCAQLTAQREADARG